MQIMPDDNLIIEQVLNGEIDHYEKLIEKYKVKLFSIVSRRIPVCDVEEVAQEAFIRAYQCLAKFAGRSSFGSWLATIAVRTCCDYWRRREKERDMRINPDQSLPVSTGWLERVCAQASAADFEAESVRAGAAELVGLVLARLKVEDRYLIELIYFEDWPLKMVAEALEWSLAKTKVRAMRARRKLKGFLFRILKEVK